MSVNHYGGRPGCSTTDALIQAHDFIKHAGHSKFGCAVVAMDVKGAYNAVQPTLLYEALTRAGLPPSIIQWASSSTTDRKAQLRLKRSFLSPVRPATVRLPQGLPVSQLFWLIYSRDMVDCTPSHRVLSIGWVDDKTLLVAGPLVDIANQVNAPP